MYADDSHDMIVYASGSGSTAGSPLDQYAWCLGNMDFSPNNQGIWDINYDITKRPLWPYTGRNADIYRCPSDASYVVVNGVARPRVRSMSMNFYLGAFDGTSGGFSVGAYRIYLKTTDLTVPGPANTFVFLDERPDWINWGNYFTDMTGYPSTPTVYQFNGDLPGMFHNLGCSFSFADCHAEIHRWLDPRTTPPLNPNSYVATILQVPRDPDVAWLQNHATGLK